MKYIDSDKLIAEIERRMTENCKLAEKAKCFGDRAVEDNDILALIESFQQEQPETDGDDAKFVKISVRKEFAELFQKLGDEIQAGQSSFFAAINPPEQPQVADASKMEQVELEKEMDNYYDSPQWEGEDVSWMTYARIARHFAEWGAAHARKED